MSDTTATRPADAGAAPVGHWKFNEQEATWNGVPFFVTAGEAPVLRSTGGRIRDLDVTGYVIVDYGVDDADFFQRCDKLNEVYARREQMVMAAASRFAGELFHPALGRYSVALTSFSFSAPIERAYYWAIEFKFTFTGLMEIDEGLVSRFGTPIFSA